MRKLTGVGVVVLVVGLAACEPGPRKPEPGSVPQGSTVATLGGSTSVAIDEDHNAVVFVDLETGGLQTVPVGQGPSQLAVKDNLLVVSNRRDRSLSVVDTNTRQVVRTIAVGPEPQGVAFLPDGNVAVTLHTRAQLAVVDVQAGTVLRRIDLPFLRPSSVAVLPDGTVYVAHLVSGRISRVDVNRGTVLGAIATDLDVGSKILTSSLMTSMTVAPDGDEVSAGNISVNNETTRGGFEDSGNSNNGYLGGPGELPAVNPTLTTVDTHNHVVTSTAGNPNGPPVGSTTCFECPPGTQMAEVGATPESALLSGLPFQLNEPVAVAYLDGGRGLAVLARGSRSVHFFERKDGKRASLRQVTPVGHGADGMALSADATQLIVHNAFDLSLSVVKIPDFSTPEERQTMLNNRARTFGPPEEVAAERTLAFAAVDLPQNVAQGRKLFFDATVPGMTTGPGITCATCHAEGRNDNRNWFFIDGARNTPSLAAAGEGRPGLLTDTAPLHWRGELAGHRELQRTVTEFMGGSGLSPVQLDQVAAFIDRIPAPDQGEPETAAQMDQVIRGAEVFNDPAVGCASCHGGVHFTDNLNHDVGTEVGQQDRADFQTPVLHGLALTPPYLHDGSAATLEDVVDRLVRTDLMGNGSHLADEDLQALVAYLRTL